MNTRLLKISEIEMNEDRTEGGKGDIESLARNMAKYGQINAVTVVEDISSPHRYRIIAGRRRIAAAVSLGWAEIRADVYAADEIGEGSEEMIALSENAAREEMNAIDEGVLYAKELKRGTPIEELAALFCRNKSTVYQRAKLASLIPEMRDLYRAGKMSLHVAAMASVLPEEAQKDIAGAGWVTEWVIKRAVTNANKDTLAQLGDCADCVGCARRTHYSDKTLFPELAETNDRCLDHDCYCKKLCAKIEAAFNAWENENKGLPEFDAWNAAEIVSSVEIPDGLVVIGMEIREIDDDAETDIRGQAGEYGISKKTIKLLQEEGKTEFVPCWDGTAFRFVELVKNEVLEAFSDNEEKDSSRTKERMERMSDIFQSLSTERREAILSDSSEWYRLENAVRNSFNQKMIDAVPKKSSSTGRVLVLVALLTVSNGMLSEYLPQAGITEDEGEYSFSAFEKLLKVSREDLCCALLKARLRLYGVKPAIERIGGSDWEKIFASLGIDLKALRDEAAKEAVGVKAEEAESEPVGQHFYHSADILAAWMEFKQKNRNDSFFLTRPRDDFTEYIVCTPSEIPAQLINDGCITIEERKFEVIDIGTVSLTPRIYPALGDKLLFKDGTFSVTWTAPKEERTDEAAVENSSDGFGDDYEETVTDEADSDDDDEEYEHASTSCEEED